MRIYQSEKGFLCAEHNGKNIHSRYNPEREAIRFLEQNTRDSNKTFILIGAGLGYIQKALDTTYPFRKILSVYTNDELHKSTFYKKPNILSWHPAESESLRSFFKKNISESELSNIQIIEWEPGIRINDDLSLFVSQTLKEVIQELNGNILTTAWFGKLWLTNLLSNYISIKNYIIPRFPEKNYLIASSGPSLIDSFSDFRKYRDEIFLIALPSSLMAFKHFGISPDLQLTTDPGYYSSAHLNHLFSDVPLAMPLTSGRIPRTHNPMVFLLNQATPFEKDLYELNGLANYRINSNGTVSGSALELSADFARKIYFAGLDLCFSDIRSHSKPHSFDSLLQSDSNRINTIHSIYYKRAYDAVPDFQNGIRSGRSLKTYRNWFSNYVQKSPVEIFRVNPSPISIEGMTKASISSLSEEKTEKKRDEGRMIEAPHADIKIRQIRSLLNSWIGDLENGEKGELFYFLDTINYTKTGNPEEAIMFLRKLKSKYD